MLKEKNFFEVTNRRINLNGETEYLILDKTQNTSIWTKYSSLSEDLINLANSYDAKNSFSNDLNKENTNLSINNYKEGNIYIHTPHKILNAQTNNNTITCLIEWKIDQNNNKPSNSFYKAEKIKELYPQVLLDFYESKIKIYLGKEAVKNLANN